MFFTNTVKIFVHLQEMNYLSVGRSILEKYLPEVSEISEVVGCGLFVRSKANIFSKDRPKTVNNIYFLLYEMKDFFHLKINQNQYKMIVAFRIP